MTSISWTSLIVSACSVVLLVIPLIFIVWLSTLPSALYWSLKEKALEALLHDASEAYLSDIAGPLKPHIKGYKEIEDKLMGVIAKKFGFEWPLSYEVKQADLLQLKTEAQYLLASHGVGWVDGINVGGQGRVPKCFHPAEAKYVFLMQYEQLVNGPVQLDLFESPVSTAVH